MPINTQSRARSEGHRAVAIIPARGNSERFKNKNIRPLGGKPLIAHTIETLLAVACFDRVIVSTDSSRIAAVAKKYGAEVPFLRSPEISGARADLLDAVTECLDNLRVLGAFIPDIVGIFLPTAPFRRRASVTDVFTRVAQGAQAGNLVRPMPLDFTDLYFRDAQGAIKKWTGGQDLSKRVVYFRDIMSVAIRLIDWPALNHRGVTPETPRYFRHYLSWFQTNQYSYVDSNDLRHGANFKGRWVYEAYGSYEESIDINTPSDLAMAEEIYRKWDASHQ